MLADTLLFNPTRESLWTPTQIERGPIETRQELLLIDKDKGFLKKPLAVSAKLTSGNYWLITSYGIMVHGAGETQGEAIEDFISMITDLYLELLQSRDQLAPHLQEELEHLKNVIIEPDF